MTERSSCATPSIAPGVFFGTPSFACNSLQALIDADLAPGLVITQPDRPKGRQRKPAPSPVKQLALAHNLALEQPSALSELSPRAQQRLRASQCAVVVAYGGILPLELLQAPRHGCLNLHASLLPRWRGAAPVQHAILAGDPETGICIMQMDQGLDTGAVLARQSCIIGQHTGGSLSELLAQMGATLLLDTLARYHQLKPQPQTAAGASYAHKINKQDARVNWHQSAEQIARQVRAFNPVPVCWCELQETQSKDDAVPLRLRIWQAEPLRGQAPARARPGEIVALQEGQIHIACGTGMLA